MSTVLVSYRTRLREDAGKFAPAAIKDNATAMASWRRDIAPGLPFACELDMVALSHPDKKRVAAFMAKPTAEGKPAVCQLVAGWLTATCAGVTDDVSFMGHDIRLFFQVLAADMFDALLSSVITRNWFSGQLKLLDVTEIISQHVGADLKPGEVYPLLGVITRPGWKNFGQDPHADLDILGQVMVHMGLE